MRLNLHRGTTWTALVMMALLSAGSAGAGLMVDYDPVADFSKYTTYSWGEGTAANQLVQRRIEAAIDEQLAAKGLTKVEGEADILVVTHATVEEEQRIEVDDFAYMARRRYAGGGTVIHVRDVAVGTLVVDLLEAHTSNLLWRAIAGETLSGKPAKIEKKVDKAALKMFKSFPPATR